MSVLLTSVPRRRLGRVPFAAGLAGLLVAGMVGLLALNIAIQSGSAQLRAAQTRAKALSDEAAAMQAEVYRIGSMKNLAQQAADMGMRPNPYGAFIDLSDGSIHGDPQRVTGFELPAMLPTATGTPTSPVQIKIYPWGEPRTPVPSGTPNAPSVDGPVTVPSEEPSTDPLASPSSPQPTAVPSETPTGDPGE